MYLEIYASKATRDFLYLKSNFPLQFSIHFWKTLSVCSTKKNERCFKITIQQSMTRYGIKTRNSYNVRGIWIISVFTIVRV